MFEATVSSVSSVFAVHCSTAFIFLAFLDALPTSQIILQSLGLRLTSQRHFCHVIGGHDSDRKLVPQLTCGQVVADADESQHLTPFLADFLPKHSCVPLGAPLPWLFCRNDFLCGIRHGSTERLE